MSMENLISYFKFGTSGKILETNKNAREFSSIFQEDRIPEEILNSILENPVNEPFSVKLSDEKAIWLIYEKTDEDTCIATFIDFSDRYQYERDIIETNEELADALEEAEIYKDKFDEQSEKMVATLDKLMEANTVIIKHNERINKELEMASKLQFNLLPKELPFRKNFSYGYKYQPSQHIGGDFFDIAQISDHQMLVVIADVSGHGVSASLVTAMFKMTFHFQARRHHSPAELFNSLNKELCDNIDQNFITAFSCLIDLNDSKITYANAGHPDMILVRPDKSMEGLKSTGMMLGLFEEENYEEESINFNKDDKLCFYTDGIAEAENVRQEIYTIERLKETVLKTLEKNPDETVTLIYKDLIKFTQNKPFDDDITMLVLKRDA